MNHALALSQFLLLDGDNASYAELSVGTVLPALLELKPALQDPVSDDAQTAAERCRWIEHLALLSYAFFDLAPMFSEEFVDSLTAEQAAAFEPRLLKLRDLADDDLKRLGVDLMLHALFSSQENGVQRDEVIGRIKVNPATAEYLGRDGPAGLKSLIQRVRGP